MIRTQILRRIRIAPLLIVLACLSAPAWSQSMGAKGEDFLYRVSQNDTLAGLAETFTHGASVWPTLQSLNQIEDPYRLPIGKVLRIPFRLIPVLPAQAQASHVVGTVTVNGRALRIDEHLSESDTLRTGADGAATLKLSDDSLLSVAPNSSLTLQRLRIFKGTGLTDSIIDIQSGSLESEVAPQNTGVGRFEVRTPITVTGVRGTNLRVHATEDGVRNEVLEGQAAIDGPRIPELAVGPGQGLAVSPQGESLGVRPLLPAPDLPTPVRGKGGWTLDFPPVQGAQSYLVRVATDSLGAFVVSSNTFAAPPVNFSARRPGTHYVFVRALDHLGLGGIDASQAFEGQTVLQNSAGHTVLSGFGEPVTLSRY